jgi:TPR repeat protein
MARNTRLIRYDEPYDRQEAYDQQDVGAFDEDANGPEFMACGSTPSMATDDYALPEDRMPLFLSNNDEQPRQPGFGTGGESHRSGLLVPRILKAGIVAASAAAIAFAALSVENPLALFANAKASLNGSSLIGSSLIGSSTDLSGSTPRSQPAVAIRLASNDRPAPTAQPAVAIQAPAQVAPTRDDIALALRAATQSRTEIVQPAVPARRLDADELAALLNRAKGLIALGDIASARLLLERAADAREASAALLLAQTYDPAVLGMQDMRSISPDPAMARDWYRKAARLGSSDAKQRLAQMQN